MLTNFKKTICLVISVFLNTAGCSSSLKIIDKPVSFSPERIELTKEYIQKHYGLETKDIRIEPKIIVLHWTAVNDFEKCFDIFNREKLEGTRPDLQGAGQVNVSIQFLVNREGKVYNLMPEEWMARHCIGLNFVSIGIENVGGEGNVDNLTEDQIEANIKIVEYLASKYPSIEYLIGHHEYREFENHFLWMEKDSTYRTEKSDPGERFMNKVREGVEDLGLKNVEDIRREKNFI